MISTEQLDAIIFDFGGVIINIDYQRSIDAFTRLGIGEFDKMYSKAQQSQLFDQLETGAISPQFFINKILEFLPNGTSPNAIVSAWNAMILDVPAERILLLNELKKKGKDLYLLSNTNYIHIEKAWRKWKDAGTTLSPHDLFSKIYLSHEVNLRKPNLDIFDLVCTENSLDKTRTLFIDDSIQHIEGALKAGLLAHHLIDKDILQLFS